MPKFIVDSPTAGDTRDRREAHMSPVARCLAVLVNRCGVEGKCVMAATSRVCTYTPILPTLPPNTKQMIMIIIMII